MMSLNKIELIGNLTRNPETRDTQSGHKMVFFTIATNFNYGEKEETEFHTIIAWDNLGEICIGLLEKGDRVYIDGRLHTYIREDADARYYNVEIIADKMLLLAKSGKKNQEQENNEQKDIEKSETELADKKNETETTEKQSNSKKSLKE